ncbi:MAG TPA: copper transporter [Actinophytocola sp.]|uniref:copper transporter n=1 Tax=Actinophytocola sp. TaxID=1872138 RepID=UPI002DBBD7C9|nr:copper transporter [Actinophytocola sp.]HEU5476041.1 copper transporter [Actinophytocola sp.]
MITLRYHIVSISAVFLALAVGIVLGSTALSRTLFGGLAAAKDDLGRQVTDLEAQRNGLAARLTDADGFATGIGPLAVAGQLAQRTIVLITTADADPVDRDAVKTLVTAAGATVTGELQLTDGFADPRRADELKDIVTRLLPAGVQLPTVSDPGTLAGGLLGPVLLIRKADNQRQASPAESAAALSGLAEGGFVRAAGEIRPAQLAIVLTGGAVSGADAGDRAATVARFAAQVDRSGAGAVLAGAAGSADGTGPIGLVRADTAAAQVLSTVDNADTPAGRIVTLLALREQLDERSGGYGIAGNAEGPVPGSPTG